MSTVQPGALNWQKQLNQYSKDFSKVVTSFEVDFLVITRWFGGLVRGTLNYGRNTQSGLKQMADFFSEDLRSELNERINSLGQLKTECSRNLIESQSSLLEMLNVVSNINRVCNTALESLTVLKISGIGLKIESSASKDCNSILAGFPEQVESVSNQMDEELHCILGDIQSLEKTLRKECRHLRTMSDQMNGGIDTNHGISDAIGDLFNQITDQLQQGETTIQEICSLASEAKYYLQFGDIARQKSEHILEALNRCEELLKSTDPDPAAWHSRNRLPEFFREGEGSGVAYGGTFPPRYVSPHPGFRRA